MPFNKECLRALRPRIEEALEALGQEFNIQLSLGSATYRGSNATFKLELAEKTAGGEVQTKEMADFKAYAWMYGLKPEHLHETITYAGNEYTIVGLKQRSPKYPLLGRAEDGKTYKLPIQAARSLTGNIAMHGIQP